jgi:predicted NUDIX family NTP pyrophosphohydrolase
MPVTSAGILLYRRKTDHHEVFLIHPGGPYWSQKDMGAWSIPKGLISPQESALGAARREFREETGLSLRRRATALGTFRQPSGKRLMAWAVEGDLDPEKMTSNSFAMIWPPKSGLLRQFPEADRGAWFARQEASRRILPGQRPILDAFFQALPDIRSGSAKK